MGIIRHGANGGFSGKAGSVVGSSWKNVAYIKGLPKKSKKPATAKQLDQQARFAVAVNFLAPISELLKEGYKNIASHKLSGFNLAVQHTLQTAIAGIYPNYSISFPDLVFSKGGLTKMTDLMMLATAPGEIDFSWATLTNKYTAFAKDQAVVLLYNEEQDVFLSYTEMALREDGGMTAEVPANFSGQSVHGYAFFITEDGERLSTSVYAGKLVLP